MLNFTNPKTKERSSDRVLVLKLMDDKAPIATTGLADRRIFTGENNLHAVMDPQTCLWNMRYDAGTVPQPLKQSFTSFKALYEYAEGYFKRRNILISEVKD